LARSFQSLANSLKPCRITPLETVIDGKGRAESEKPSQQQKRGRQISRNYGARCLAFGDPLQQNKHSSLGGECISPHLLGLTPQLLVTRLCCAQEKQLFESFKSGVHLALQDGSGVA